MSRSNLLFTTSKSDWKLYVLVIAYFQPPEKANLIYSLSRLRGLPQNEYGLKNEDDPKNEEDLRNEDDLKNENDFKNEDDLKK